MSSQAGHQALLNLGDQYRPGITDEASSTWFDIGVKLMHKTFTSLVDYHRSSMVVSLGTYWIIKAREHEGGSSPRVDRVVYRERARTSVH